EETRRLLAVRLAELIAYQSPRCAERYLDDVLRVAAAERALPAAEGQLTESVARGLFKLTAYKDEYEVARLLLDPAFPAQVAADFEQPVRIAWNLHPPLLPRLGRHL